MTVQIDVDSDSANFPHTTVRTENILNDSGTKPNPYEGPPGENGNANTQSPWLKVVVFVVAAAIGTFAYVRYGDQITFQNLAEQEARLREVYEAQPAMVYAGAFALYVVVSGLSIPGGAVALSLAYGSFFGWLRAVALVSFASTAGATVAFLLSRYIFRDFIQRKFVQQLTSINAKLDEEGAYYLFTLRLIPLVPFFMLNLVMGLTRMRWTTYWWVSQVGMLAGTMAYVYAGSTVQISELAEHGFRGLGWDVALGFAILGVLPWVTKKIMSAVKGNGPSGV